MNNPITRALAALMFATVLVVGSFAATPAQVVRAESGSSLESMDVGELRSLLLSLLQQLLVLLEQERDSVSDDTEDDDSSCATTGLSELEASVFTDETVVNIELNGDKDVLTTEADTRSGIIDAILESYPSLSVSEVDDMLTVEDEDRASRASDKDWANGDSSSCEDDNEDEDEDEDEDEEDEEDDEEEDD